MEKKKKKRATDFIKIIISAHNLEFPMGYIVYNLPTAYGT